MGAFIVINKNAFKKMNKARLVIVVLSIAIVISACSISRDDLTPALAPGELLRSVKVEYNAYNIAFEDLYDTVTLKVSGISGTNERMDHVVTYTYDPKYLTINDQGLMKALATVSNTKVVASMTYRGATRSDTAIVSIFPTHKLMERVGLELNPGDSAKTAVPLASARLMKSLRLIRLDLNSENVSNLSVHVNSSDTAIARIAQAGNNLTVTALRPGTVKLTVSTYAFGRGFSEELPFTIGWPLGWDIGMYTKYVTGSKEPILELRNGIVVVGVGACVSWYNASKELDVDIVFDQPDFALPADSAPAISLASCKYNGQYEISSTVYKGGNIAPWRMIDTSDFDVSLPSRSRSRVFNTAGIYTYRSELSGFRGKIIVCDETNDDTCKPEKFDWGALNNEK